ncbi:uncharacterized protein FOBCDRAFT_236188 [Fusarium oxysporum Fo47]|uniref:uncharacterized protein n=1 Tax=Fusarium oxysporum Fo47 TaxID=660027 RepID=UPI002869D180|nr:uncharacterized protein FOBCDRAFT_236188 [Fusarium oxysporum Fo47]QKD48531.2 hypothetical protein FOBCDRAFT_236188 [Fusarium oxysporum Fo47]
MNSFSNQHGIPTLAYNCAKVPASCENVHQQYPLATTVHAAPAGVVTSHHTILGARSHLQLHFDRDDNSGGRRGKACAKNWKNHHNCPESNQPDTVPAGAMMGDGSFPAARWNPNNLVMGDAGYNRIANAAGQFSGMMWTCDEFPFATYETPYQNPYHESETETFASAVLLKEVPEREHTVPHRTQHVDFQSNALSWDRHLVGNGSAVDLEQGNLKRSMGQMQSRDNDNGTVGLSADWLNASGNSTNPARQAYEDLPEGPPLPILEIAQDFVEEQKEDKPAEEPYIVRAVKASDGNESSICDFVTPCPDGSCCNRKGQCGYGEEVCGSKVCVSNCDATAACGKDSLGGKVKCPLNVCCSAYGYCGVEDDFCRAGNADNSCQKGFGSCTKIEPPSCGGCSAFARSIGYYQFANMRERQCNRITPKQIRTEGFTHLAWILTGSNHQIPGAPDRGGRKEDTDNYVSLLKDMRAAFGSKYGISIAIPTSYWYLRWFKPKEIEQYVDYMGIMTYDLHGPWDEDVKQVNMGLAYYARGYTVADSNCNGVGCKWSGTSRPAPCTNFGGVMSLEEIGRMWIGYDNEDTIYMKKKWASSRCFGGTMVWSVDMFSGSGSGDTPDDQSDGGSEDPGGGQGDGSGVIYIDPEIWEEDQPELTTIWSTFDITPSIKVPTFIITNRLPETTKDSVTQPPGTRTITPPPYPWTYTPPTTRPSNTPGDDDDDDDEVIPPFPVVTWRPGKPGPICKKNCDKTCRVFCSHPCLLNCPDGGGDFADPRNPKPPKRPVPPNPTIPKPTGKPAKPTKIPTPGTTPENKEHEDNERQCAIEFGLPLPTWRDPATTTSVKPKPTPPKPSPKPDPKPPSPNPKTEEVKCYGIGGQVLDATKPETERTLECQHGVVCTGDGFGCVVDVLMSVTVKNWCRFTVGGKGLKSECGRILRRMIDECDTSDVRYKKGGTMSSNCADWKFDPNYRGWWSKNQCSA